MPLNGLFDSPGCTQMQEQQAIRWNGGDLAVKSRYISEYFQSTVASIVVLLNFTSTSTFLESWLIIYPLLAPKITEATIFIVIRCLIVTLIVHKSSMMKARLYMTIYMVIWLYKWFLNFQNLWALISILKQCLAFYYCNVCRYTNAFYIVWLKLHNFDLFSKTWSCMYFISYIVVHTYGTHYNIFILL